MRSSWRRKAAISTWARWATTRRDGMELPPPWRAAADLVALAAELRAARPELEQEGRPALDGEEPQAPRRGVAQARELGRARLQEVAAAALCWAPLTTSVR